MWNDTDGEVEDGGPEEENWDEDAWAEEDESETTAPCSACGADIYDDAVQCPVCGHYQSGLGAQGVPLWVKWAGITVLAALLLSLLWRFAL